MRRLILAAIRFYQRHLSPRKGFRCAYHQHTGRATCSQLGARAVRRFGAVSGLAVLRERLFRCGVAARRHRPARPRGPIAQRGDCDPNCDLPCDIDLPNWGSSGSGSGGCGCDWPHGGRRERKRKRKRQDGQSMHLPPQRKGS